MLFPKEAATMKKIIPTVWALLATAALFFTLFFMLFRQDAPDHSAGSCVTRIWLVETEADCAAFLRKQAAAWAKQTGARVFLRAASQEEALGALAGAEDIVAPDLIVGLPEGECLLFRGYALIFRDDSAPVFTPAPTSLLFSPPSPSPGPSLSPAPTRCVSSFSGLLCPRDMAPLFPESIPCNDPLQDFIRGKGSAALLTARQAAQLKIGWQGQALPDGKGALPLYARGLSGQGNALLSFLMRPESQMLLRDYGLYSPLFPLYAQDASLAGSIDRSLPR